MSMEIRIAWHDSGKYPSFNVELAGAAGADAFLVIKGCRIMNSDKGDWISWPATKNERTGKWWNHVYAGEKFAAAVLQKAQAALPKTARPAAKPDDDDQIPF